MYVSRGDLGNYVDALVDHSVPLLITSAGSIRPRSARKFYTIRPEGREDFQLIYVSDGCAHFRFEADGPDVVVEKGNMVLFWPGQYQDYKLYSAEYGEFYWVHFTGSAVESLLAELQIPRNRNVFPVGTLSDCRWMLHQTIRELQLRQTHYEELLRMNLRHLLMLIHRNMTETEEPKPSFHGEIIQSLTYFERHWQDNLSIEDYAIRNRMTPCWFRQKFKEYVGCSPLQYIINLRMTNAMNLLENTDYNITQVSYAVGYENVSYFRRLFQRHTGMTPGEYQRSKRKK